MTEGAGRALVYKSFNLVQQITQGSITIGFTYDAGHARVKKTEGGNTTLYLTDAGSGATEEHFTAGSTVTERDYVVAEGRAFAERFKTGATVTWEYFVTDHLGSVAAIT